MIVRLDDLCAFACWRMTVDKVPEDFRVQATDFSRSALSDFDHSQAGGRAVVASRWAEVGRLSPRRDSRIKYLYRLSAWPGRRCRVPNCGDATARATPSEVVDG